MLSCERGTDQGNSVTSTTAEISMMLLFVPGSPLWQKRVREPPGEKLDLQRMSRSVSSTMGGFG